MANEEITKIINYERLTRIKLKSGLIFSYTRDPSEDLNNEIATFLNSRRSEFNRTVSSAFDLPEGEYTKYEFIWSPKRAQAVSNSGDRISGNDVEFRSSADVTVLYMKSRSLIIFKTDFLFAVTKPGCGGNGQIWVSGGRNYTLEEIYFNKITTVGAYHDEELLNVLKPGCGGGQTTSFTIVRDGFTIRAGESFRVVASERFSNELRDARAEINARISETN